jgi:hypothetical protein
MVLSVSIGIDNDKDTEGGRMKATKRSNAPAGPILHDQVLIIEEAGIPIEHRLLPLKDLQLDSSNPRIQHAVRQRFKDTEVTQDELQKLIMELPGVPELFKSIRDNGGLLEPIYVRPDGRVIEGNCRAACYLKLRASLKGKESRWDKIPAILVPSISNRQVAILQGHYHVAGKNKWQAYEKAGHLHTMRTVLKMDDKAIALALGMRERDVTRDLRAYETMTNKLLPQMKGGNGLDKWSFVQELFKRKDLEEYRNKPENVDDFVSLVVNNKIKYGADVRKLPKILKHAPATRVLAKQGVESALSVVGKVDPTADSGTFRKLKEATRLLQQLPSREIQRLRENENSRTILQDLFSALKDAAKAAGVKLSQ